MHAEPVGTNADGHTNYRDRGQNDWVTSALRRGWKSWTLAHGGGPQCFLRQSGIALCAFGQARVRLHGFRSNGLRPGARRFVCCRCRRHWGERPWLRFHGG